MHDRRTGYAKMAETRPLYEEAMEGCPTVWNMMNEILKQADGLMTNTSWNTMQKQIYDEKKVQIDRAVDL